MKIPRKGQGSTEYLLILAIVLIIAAIAVIYMSTTGGRKQVMTMTAVFDTTDNSIDIKITAGTLPRIDYQYRIIDPNGNVNQDWTDGTTDLDPKNSPVELIKLGESPTKGNWTVKIYHKPSKSTYEDLIVNVSY